MTQRLVAAAVALAVAGMPAPATAAGRDLRLGPVHVVGAGRLLAVGVSDGGRALAVWTRDDSSVLVSIRTPSGSWQPPATIRGASPCPPEVATSSINARGDAVVAWTERCPRSELDFRGKVATRIAGRWSTLRRVGVYASVGITRLGDAIVAWRSPSMYAKDPSDVADVRVKQQHHGVWSATRRLATTREDLSSSPALDVSANGRAVLMWGTTSGLWWSRRSPDGRWTPGERVPGARAPGNPESAPLAVGITADGEVVAAHSLDPRPAPEPRFHDVVEELEFHPQSGWSPPRALDTIVSRAEPLTSVALEVNDHGEAALAWTRWAQLSPGAARIGIELYATTRSADGGLARSCATQPFRGANGSEL